MATKSPLADNAKYYVTRWDNGTVLAEYDSPTVAKKHAKELGSEYSRFFGNMPVAYVAADYKNWDYETNSWSNKNVSRCVFYNPRFKEVEK